VAEPRSETGISLGGETGNASAGPNPKGLSMLTILLIIVILLLLFGGGWGYSRRSRY
jgi:hypothetical protein